MCFDRLSDEEASLLLFDGAPAGPSAKDGFKPSGPAG